MKKRTLITAIITISILTTIIMPESAHPGVGSAGRKAVGEVVEYLSRAFGREVAEEGGEAVVRTGVARVLGRYGSKYGDELIVLFKKLGPGSVKMADSYGDDAIKIMTRWGDDGLRLLGRSADDVIPLFNRYGDDAVEVCIKHPGVGEKLIGQMGEEGIRIGKKLDTNQVIQVLRASPELARKGKLKAFGSLAAKHGEKLFTFIEKHKTLMLGVPAFIYIVNHPEVLEPAGRAGGGAVGEAMKGALEGATRGTFSTLMPEKEERQIAILIIAAVILIIAIIWLSLRHRRKMLGIHIKAGRGKAQKT